MPLDHTFNRRAYENREPRFDEHSMNQNTRIGLEDNLRSALPKLAEGNPGAATALIKLCSVAALIDPDSAFRELGPLIELDSNGIYGPHIWMLWKDICDFDPVKVETLFRASQLGIMRHGLLYEHTRGRSGPDVFDFEKLNAQVRERLPKFAALGTKF